MLEYWWWILYFSLLGIYPGDCPHTSFVSFYSFFFSEGVLLVVVFQIILRGIPPFFAGRFCACLFISMSYLGGGPLVWNHG